MKRRDRQPPSRYRVAPALVAALAACTLQGACGGHTNAPGPDGPHDAGASGGAASMAGAPSFGSGGALPATGGTKATGTGGSAGTKATGTGGSAGATDAGTPSGACEDLSGALPPDCAPSLCSCVASLADHCDLECWKRVACVRQRCRASAGDPSCFAACPEIPAAPREALWRCMGKIPECTIGSCGDGIVNGEELCDVAIRSDLTCQSIGAGAGELKCTSKCELDMTGCKTCGDGTLDPGEECDLGDMNGASCTSLGFTRGTLVCDPKTCLFDDSLCERCGNSRLDDGEPCDGKLVDPHITCRRFGYSGGTLGCKACELDPSVCASCGNGVVEPGENCDGTAFGSATCAKFGFTGGQLKCDTDACRIDVSGCTNATPLTCGNSVAERGEDCDGKDLLGLDCKALGFDSGTLTCSSTCRLVDSGCAFAARDECKECRTNKCASQNAACEKSPRCADGFECLNDCLATESQPTCGMRCFSTTDFDGGDPNQAPYALAEFLFGCVASRCSEACIGLL